jgi:hypothetical protein
MKDFDEQTGGSFTDSAFAARLFRRVSEPLGVINVRHPEKLHARGTAFVGQRMEMLNTWKTRYGLINPEAPADRVGPPPLRNFGYLAGNESLSVSSPQPRVMRSASTGVDVDPKFPVAEHVERYRLKRTRELPTTSARLSDTAFQHNFQTAIEPLLRARELPAQSQSTPPLYRQRAADEGLSASGPPIGNIESSAAAPSKPVAAAPSSSLDASVMTRVTPMLPAAEVLALRGDPGMILQRKVMEEWRPAAVSRWQDTQDLPGSQVSGSRPLVREIRGIDSASPADPFVSRKEIPVVQQPLRTGAIRPSSSIVSEIPTTLSVPKAAAIVWRRINPLAADQSSQPMAARVTIGANAQIMRAPAVNSDPLASQPVPSQQDFAHLSSGGGIDVEHLAQRVSRVIARDLAVARERRGIAQ